MTKLDRDEVITKWVEALRSGKYKQGTSQLRSKFDRGERHCCLGVLCDIVPGVEWTERKSGDHIHWIATFNESSSASVLPSAVAKVAGLNTTGYFKMANVSQKWQKQIKKLLRTSDDFSMLISLNDLGMSFHEIADFIDENREAFRVRSDKN